GGQPLAVWAEGEALDLRDHAIVRPFGLVGGEGEEFLARRDVPHAHGEIAWPARRDPPGTWAERHAGHRAQAAVPEDMPWPAGGRVPETDGEIAAAGRDVFAVTAPGRGREVRGVADQLEELLACLDVPDMAGVLQVGGYQPFAVRAEGQSGDSP